MADIAKLNNSMMGYVMLYKAKQGTKTMTIDKISELESTIFDLEHKIMDKEIEIEGLEDDIETLESKLESVHDRVRSVWLEADLCQTDEDKLMLWETMLRDLEYLERATKD